MPDAFISRRPRGRARVPRVRAAVDGGGERLSRPGDARLHRAASARGCEALGMTATPHLTQSNGGVIGFEHGRRDAGAHDPVRARRPAWSARRRVGRAGGLRGPHHLRHGRHLDRRRAAARTASCRLAAEAIVHGYPIKAPMLDIHTVGAGGGSIAYVDSGGLLKVGPRSAGADPGPACYGRGNAEPDRHRRQRRAADAEPDAPAGRAHDRSGRISPERRSSGWPRSSAWTRWQPRRASSRSSPPTWRARSA